MSCAHRRACVGRARRHHRPLVSRGRLPGRASTVVPAARRLRDRQVVRHPARHAEPLRPTAAAASRRDAPRGQLVAQRGARRRRRRRPARRRAPRRRRPRTRRAGSPRSTSPSVPAHDRLVQLGQLAGDARPGDRDRARRRGRSSCAARGAAPRRARSCGARRPARPAGRAGPAPIGAGSPRTRTGSVGRPLDDQGRHDRRRARARSSRRSRRRARPRTSRSPGSLMPGVPASVTTATSPPVAEHGEHLGDPGALGVLVARRPAGRRAIAGVLRAVGRCAACPRSRPARPRRARRRPAATGRRGCRSGVATSTSRPRGARPAGQSRPRPLSGAVAQLDDVADAQAPPLERARPRPRSPSAACVTGKPTRWRRHADRLDHDAVGVDVAPRRAAKRIPKVCTHRHRVSTIAPSRPSRCEQPRGVAAARTPTSAEARTRASLTNQATPRAWHARASPDPRRGHVRTRVGEPCGWLQSAEDGAGYERPARRTTTGGSECPAASSATGSSARKTRSS